MTAAKSPSHSNNHSFTYQIKSNDQTVSMEFKQKFADHRLVELANSYGFKQTKNSTYTSKTDF